MSRRLSSVLSFVLTILPAFALAQSNVGQGAENGPKRAPVSQVPVPLEGAHQIASSTIECRLWLVLHVDLVPQTEPMTGTPSGLRFSITIEPVDPSQPLRQGHLVFSLVHGPTLEVLGRLPRAPIDFSYGARANLAGGTTPSVVAQWLDAYAKAFDEFSLVGARRLQALGLMSGVRSESVLSEFGRADAKRLVAMALAGASYFEMRSRVLAAYDGDNDRLSLPTAAKCVAQGVEASLFSRALDQVINRSINVAVLNNLDNFVKNLGNQAATDRRETVRELIQLVKDDPKLLQELQELLKGTGKP